MSIALVLSGCAAAGEGDGESVTFEEVVADARAGGASSAQLAMMDDGVVSIADYTQGVANVRGCMEVLGVRTTEPLVNPVDGWRMDFDLDAGEIVDLGLVDEVNECWDAEITFLEIGYEFTGGARMAPDLMAAVQECLGDRGIVTSGTEREVADLLPEGALDEGRAGAVVACIRDKGLLLYPDRAIVTTY